MVRDGDILLAGATVVGGLFLYQYLKKKPATRTAAPRETIPVTVYRQPTSGLYASFVMSPSGRTPIWGRTESETVAKVRASGMRPITRDESIDGFASVRFSRKLGYGLIFHRVVPMVIRG